MRADRPCRPGPGGTDGACRAGALALCLRGLCAALRRGPFFGHRVPEHPCRLFHSHDGGRGALGRRRPAASGRPDGQTPLPRSGADPGAGAALVPGPSAGGKPAAALPRRRAGRAGRHPCRAGRAAVELLRRGHAAARDQERHDQLPPAAAGAWRGMRAALADERRDRRQLRRAAGRGAELAFLFVGA